MIDPNSRSALVRERFEEGDYLGIAEAILPYEQKGAEIGESTITWDSRSFGHFITPLALEKASFTGYLESNSIKVNQVLFHVFGEDEMELLVDTDNLDFVRQDPLSTDAIRTFVNVYAAHPHIVCLKSLRNRRLEEVAKLNENRERQRNNGRRGFRVTLNGIAQPDI